jgi:hypothetical protein
LPSFPLIAEYRVVIGTEHDGGSASFAMDCKADPFRHSVLQSSQNVTLRLLCAEDLSCRSGAASNASRSGKFRGGQRRSRLAETKPGTERQEGEESPDRIE